MQIVDFVSSPLVAPPLIQQGIASHWPMTPSCKREKKNLQFSRERRRAYDDKSFHYKIGAHSVMFLLSCWPTGLDWLNLENTEGEFLFAGFDWSDSKNTKWEFLCHSIYGRKRG